MPWSVKKDPEACSEEKPWAVVQDDNGEVVGCHATEEDARAQQAALYASEEGDGHATSDEFELVILVTGQRTGDGREFAADSVTFRELPLPLMWQYEEPDGFNGHAKSVLVGQITDIYQEGDEWRGRGRWDDSEDAREAKRRVDNQMQRWVSADMDDVEMEFMDDPPGCSMDDMMFLFHEEAAEEKPPCETWTLFTKARIMGATMVAKPAFPQAVIVPAGTEIPAASENGRPASVVAAGCGDCLIAAAIPTEPPAEWFQKPTLEAPTPLSVTDEGRVFGHAAPWGECHIGRDDICMTAPSSAARYAYFHTGSVRCANGATVACGQITLAGGHASLSADPRSAAAHYDDTQSAVADVVCGEDEHGIWFSGALRPGVTDEQIRTLRASGVSGDWRKIGGGLELVALLSVNVPGFPIVRPAAAVASGSQLSLVAAGYSALYGRGREQRRRVAVEHRLASVEAELASLRRVVAALRPTAASALMDRIRGGA